MKLDAGKTRSLLFERGLTQKALAERSGLKVMTVNNALRGHGCRYETATAIANALNVKLENILA